MLSEKIVGPKKILDLKKILGLKDFLSEKKFSWEIFLVQKHFQPKNLFFCLEKIFWSEKKLYLDNSMDDLKFVSKVNRRSMRVSEKSRSRQFLANLDKSQSRQPWKLWSRPNLDLDNSQIMSLAQISISTILEIWVSCKSRSRQFWKFESRANLDLDNFQIFYLEIEIF